MNATPARVFRAGWYNEIFCNRAEIAEIDDEVKSYMRD